MKGCFFYTMKEQVKIVSFGQNRYAISDLDGKIIDDANGYGYKTSKSAYLAMKYKFLGGKQKSYSQKKQFRDWIKNPEHKKISKEFNDLLECNFKEIARGETSINDIWKHIEDSHKIEIPSFVKKQILK